MFPVLPVVVLLLFAIAWLAWFAAMRALDRAAGAEWGNKLANRIDGLNRIFCRRYHRLSAQCIPLPERGAALLVANHLSGVDPLLLMAASRRPLRFIIAQEHYQRFGLQWLFKLAGCIPVDRTERPERAFRMALRVLQAGEVVALFPQGGIRLDTEPRRPLKPGVARLAHLAKVPVYATRIDGVSAQGTVFASVVRRGHARVTGAVEVDCHTLTTQECLVRVAAIIESPSKPA